MAASLRGQLGVKSSPLSPTSSKLTTQMLVISHMDNHYKKITKAKSAIDNAPPKSMLSSQKLRDRQVQKYVEKYGSRPTSRAAYRPESALDIYDEQQWEEPENDEARQVRDIMRSTLRVPLKTERGVDSVDATAGSKSTSAVGFGSTTMRPQSARVTQVMQASALISRMRPMSARSTTSITSNYSQTSRSTNPLKVTYDGDVLNKHAHNFTEPTKPFIPRTLKSNRESSLKQYKYYTPPPRKSQVPNNMGPTSAKKDDDKHVKEMVTPKAKPRRRSSRGGGDLGATETLTETMLMDMSLQSHGEQRQHSGGDSGGVPRLDISMDKDHLHWMQEQATRAQIRVGTNGHASHRQDSTGGPADGGDTLEQTGTLGQTDTLRFTRTTSFAKSFGIKSPTSHRLSQAEEEQKYVKFAHEVTQDIVSRSISSDRVLQKVFENHIERKKGELDERRLRAIITDIRRDLGVQNVEPWEKKSVQYSEDLEQTEDSVFQTQQDMGMTMGSTFTSMDSTMESGTNNTFNFERTTDVLSTIHSQREEEEGEDLSATATLKQYQMTLSVKAGADEEAEDISAPSESLDHTMSTDKGAATLGSTLVNGDVESESAEDGSQYISERAVDEEYHPSPRPRRLAKQDLRATEGQEDLSRHDSVTDTDAKTEVEEEVEEDYEDDYDADDDDNQEKASDDDF